MASICAPNEEIGLTGRLDPDSTLTTDVPGLQERLRVQTLTRYFTPARITANTVKSPNGPPVTPTLSNNTHLTGLAQIGPLKLSCDRAFVSLLDTSTQYIIAEATRTISLRHSDRHATPQDALFLGLQALHKSYGVCPNTIQVFTDETGEQAVDTQDVVANASRYVIRDFREIEAFADKPYVVGFPHMRSYAEVPMKSSNGRVIGSYCVVDTDIRDDFFSEDTVFTLTEIASSIVDYLEMLTVSLNHDRGARLMEGLSRFAEGRSSSKSEAIAPGEHESSTQAQLGREGSTASTYASIHPKTTSDEWNFSASATPDSAESASDPSLFEQCTPQTTPFESPDFDASFAKENERRRQEEESQRPLASSAYSAIFSRAAHLIREAMEMEGVVFLDAPMQEAGELIRQNISRRSSNYPATRATAAAQSFNNTNIFSDGQDRDNTADGVEPSSPCQILASSLALGKPASLQGPSGGPVAPSEASLRYLAKRYPHGHVFFADDHGVLIPQDESANLTRPGTGKLSDGPPVGGNLPSELEKLFAASRSTIFLPLWDFSKEQFFAGILGWTADPTRVFDKEDFTCLIAFGDALMTELARVEAIDVARAKSDFVSCISHELRSPLHGILASAELLDEVLTEDIQTELVRMIDSCGTTLLDTLNNLLDFSVGNFNDAKGHARTNSDPGGPKQGTRGRILDDNLAELLQSVMEGVYFGYTARDLVHRNLASRTEKPTRSSPSPPESGEQVPHSQDDSHVAVLIDIEDRSDWHMPLHIGGWKRIIMNIFANALKYTPCGQIEASLSMLTAKGQDGSIKQAARLTISDTGIGMSAEYLKHRLYRPFTQENSLSSGTGLGLSIVKQIIDSLGGTINVQSEVGVGTRFDIVVPLMLRSSPNLAAPVSLAGKLDPDGLLRGKTVCLVNFDGCPDLDEVPTGLVSVHSKRISATRHSVTKIATNWFGMVVISAQSLEEAEADFYLTETSLNSNLTKLQSEHLGLFDKKRIISIASTIHDRKGLVNSHFTQIAYPIGPRTFGKVLLTALRADKKAHSTPREPDVDLVSEAQQSNTAQTCHDTLLVHVDMKTEKDPETPPGKKHLLLVDDNDINLRILNSYVKKLGCTTVTAKDGSDAVTKYKSSERRFDIVFMDISMPIMDGFEASLGIRDFERQNNNSYRTRIIALTGLGSDASRRKAVMSGIDEFCMKPVPLKDVKAILDAT